MSPRELSNAEVIDTLHKMILFNFTLCVILIYGLTLLSHCDNVNTIHYIICVIDVNVSRLVFITAIAGIVLFTSFQVDYANRYYIR